MAQELEEGALNNTYDLRKTLLDIACEYGNIDAVKKLLELGGKITKLESRLDSYKPEVLKILLQQDEFPLLKRPGETEEQFKSQVKECKESLIRRNSWDDKKIDAGVLEILLNDKTLKISSDVFNSLIAHKNYKAANVFIEKRRDSLEPSLIGAIVSTDFHFQARYNYTFLAGVPKDYQNALQRETFLYSMPIACFVSLPLAIVYDSPAPMLLVPLYLVLNGMYNKYYLIPGFLDAVAKLGQELEAKEKAEAQNKVEQTPTENDITISLEDKNEFIAECINGEIETVKAKLKDQATLATTAKTVGGLTGIHIAIQTQNLKLLECFLAEQIMAAIDEKEVTPFDLLMQLRKDKEFDKDNKILDYFFEHVFNTKHVDALKRTPLHIAAKYNNLDLAKRALEIDGLNLLAKDKNGNTALYLSLNNKDLLEVIIPFYKDIKPTEDAQADLKRVLNKLIEEKNIVLFAEVLTLLKSNKIDIQPISNDILADAIARKNSNAVDSMIELVETIDPKHLFNASTLDRYASKETLRILRSLIKAGGQQGQDEKAKLDLNAINKKGNWLDNFLQDTYSKQEFLKDSGYYNEIWKERVLASTCALATFAAIQYTDRSAFIQVCLSGFAYKVSANYYDKHYLKPTVEANISAMEII
ncbi:MAG: ankyrin repeat domain-containing protein [Alphaproteobacteria bacterium]|nr:ankyrin repeat domain-containing protein [Candidatus Jidaibacter sp.]